MTPFIDKDISPCLKEANKLIRNCYNDLNQKSTNELIEHWESINFRNSTLCYGASGVILSLANSYKYNRSANLISYIKQQISLLPYSESNYGLCYGLGGNLLALISYLDVTNDENIIDKANKTVENILSLLFLTPKIYYNQLGFDSGTTGILLLLHAIQDIFHDEDKIIITDILKTIITYEDAQFNILNDEKRIQDDTIVEMLYVRKQILKNSTNDSLNILINNSISYIEANSHLNGKTILQLKKHQLEISSFLNSFRFGENNYNLSLDYNNIVFLQLNSKFSRSLKKIDFEIDFNKFYHANSINVLESFASYVSSNISDGIFKKMFLFEYKKLKLELELRHINPENVFEKEKEEIKTALETIKLDNETFFNTSFIIPDSVYFIENNYYESYEIEREYVPTENYIVALKPKKINGDLYLTETCLQNTYRILLIIKKYNMPITPSKILDIFISNAREEDKTIVKTKVSRFLRKMVARSFLVPFNE